MQEGVDHDDAFRMVEDEFVITAKLFTQQIHFAEYVRLKKLARSRGQDALAAMRRGTDGRTEKSAALQLQEEAEENARQRDGEQDSEEDDEYLQDPQLAGLMSGPRIGKVERPGLPAVARPQIRRRSTMGSSPPALYDDNLDAVQDGHENTIDKGASPLHGDDSDDDETDDDDLNVAVELSSHRAPVSTPTGESPLYKTPRTGKSSSVGNDFDVAGEVRKVDRRGAGNKRLPSDIDTHYTSSAASNKQGSAFQKSSLSSPSTNKSLNGTSGAGSKAAAYIAQKKAAREKREEDERRKAVRATEIPTFIL